MESKSTLEYPERYFISLPTKAEIEVFPNVQFKKSKVTIRIFNIKKFPFKNDEGELKERVLYYAQIMTPLIQLLPNQEVKYNKYIELCKKGIKVGKFFLNFFYE